MFSRSREERKATERKVLYALDTAASMNGVKGACPLAGSRGGAPAAGGIAVRQSQKQ